ncbi:hypothetical protein EMPG_10087 [Blastomyces silverae]|uniref:Uncharacterized protein n=1 Tax=Blastomyces silverae TaxID=2060906 RepID=A0A0H1B516_9EURO|nr:hypothetical protein EMPG_10087 [Blastomyces silverae]
MVRGYQDVRTKPDAWKYDVLITIRWQVVRSGKPRARILGHNRVRHFKTPATGEVEQERGLARQLIMGMKRATVGWVDRVREEARLGQEAVRTGSWLEPH